MDDRERIEALAVEGRITREEADRLLNVLDDMDRAEEELGGVDAEVKAAEKAREWTPKDSETHTGFDQRAAAASTDRGGQTTATRPTDIRWLEVNLLAGDLDIEVDASATTPSAVSKGAGKIELEATDNGYKLGGFGNKNNKDEGFLGRLIGGFTRGETVLTIPPEWGVRLAMKAGDVTIRGPLRFLAGHLLAGDLDVDEVHGVDLNVSAGDIDLGLRVTEGKNRVHAIAGDLNVRLLPGSDARLSGRVNIGEIQLPKQWERVSRGIGHSFEKQLGQGHAQLSLEVGTGELEVRLADA